MQLSIKKLAALIVINCQPEQDEVKAISAAFRDNIIRLGATKMSAGSSTRVGGWTSGAKDIGQFDIADHRSVQEIKLQIQKLGYQPVFKDWQPIMDEAV